jgi:hypothetical protein
MAKFQIPKWQNYEKPLMKLDAETRQRMAQERIKAQKLLALATGGSEAGHIILSLHFHAWVERYNSTHRIYQF